MQQFSSVFNQSNGAFARGDGGNVNAVAGAAYHQLAQIPHGLLFALFGGQPALLLHGFALVAGARQPICRPTLHQFPLNRRREEHIRQHHLFHPYAVLLQNAVFAAFQFLWQKAVLGRKRVVFRFGQALIDSLANYLKRGRFLFHAIARLQAEKFLQRKALKAFPPNVNSDVGRNPAPVQKPTLLTTLRSFHVNWPANGRPPSRNGVPVQLSAETAFFILFLRNTIWVVIKVENDGNARHNLYAVARLRTCAPTAVLALFILLIAFALGLRQKRIFALIRAKGAAMQP